MARSADGWFEAERHVRRRRALSLPLPDGTCVPDPASRAQAGDVHGAERRGRSARLRAGATAMARTAVGRGRDLRAARRHCSAAFAGVARELPRLAELGVTAVELMPIAEFPGRAQLGLRRRAAVRARRSYGTPDDLKALIDAAHGLGLMMLLDVVYNHFGPDGNYLRALRAAVLPRGRHDAVGRRPSTSASREVRDFFIDNALYWLEEYRFDGLRFDAVHAIAEPDWLDEMAAAGARSASSRAATSIWCSRTTTTRPRYLRAAISTRSGTTTSTTSLHVLLTGESDGYYADYADQPAEQLARCLAEGFVYQGEPSAYRGGEPRGKPSARSAADRLRAVPAEPRPDRQPRLRRAPDDAAPTRRALEAAIALLLLCPQIPLLFMGEEDASRTPFLFFTDLHAELARRRARRPAARIRQASRHSPIRSICGNTSPTPTRCAPSSAPFRAPMPSAVQARRTRFTAT